MRRQHRTLRVRLRQHDRKLLAAVSGDEVTGAPHMVLERARDLGQTRVARLVPKLVGVLPKTVDIDQQHADGRGVTKRASPLGLKAFLKRTVVRQ